MPSQLTDIVFPQVVQHATKVAIAHVLCCIGLGLTGLLSSEPDLVVAFLCCAGALGSYLWIQWIDDNNNGQTTGGTYMFIATITISLGGAVSVLVRRWVYGQRPPHEHDSDDECEEQDEAGKDRKSGDDPSLQLDAERAGSMPLCAPVGTSDETAAGPSPVPYPASGAARKRK